MQNIQLRLLLMLFAVGTLAAQDETPVNDLASYGTEFVISLPASGNETNFKGQLDYVYLYISAPYETNVHLNNYVHANNQIVRTRANDVLRVPISRSFLQLHRIHNGNNKQDYYENRALILTADAPVSVSLLVDDFGESESVLLMPTASLGYEYVVADMADSRTPTRSAKPSQTVISARSDYTKVWFTVGGNSTSTVNNGMVSGETREYTLHRGDVLSFQTNSDGSDLSGSYIRADQPVAVYSGNYCATVPTNTGACEHILSAEIPLSSWNSSYHVPTLLERENSPMIKIVTAEDNTTILRDGAEFTTIESGRGGLVNSGYYAGPAGEAAARGVSLTAEKPFAVKFFNRANMDDSTPFNPFAIQLVPVAQYVNYARFYLPPEALLNFVTIIHAVDANGEVDENIDFGIETDGEMDWVPLRIRYGAAPGERFASVGDGNIWAQKRIVLPKSGTSYAIRSSSKPFVAYTYGTVQNATFGMRTSGVKRGPTNGDDLAPEHAITLDDGTRFKGWVREVAQDGLTPSGLISVKVLPNLSDNMSFNIPNFGPGSTAILDWNASPINANLGARAVIEMQDLRGNRGRFTLNYEPEGPALRSDPDEITLRLRGRGGADSVSVEIFNTSFTRELEISSIRLESESESLALFGVPDWPVVLTPQGPTNEANSIKVGVELSGFIGGDHLAKLLVQVKGEPEVEVADVIGDIWEETLRLRYEKFDGVFEGSKGESTIIISNNHPVSAEIVELIDMDNPAFRFVDFVEDLGGEPMIIPAGAHKSVRFEFEPTEIGEAIARYGIVYRFEDRQELTVNGIVLGEGLDILTSVDESIALNLNTTIVAHPNPASGALTVKFQMLSPALVALELFDVRGNVALSLPSQWFAAGDQRVKLDVSTLAVGRYFCRLVAGDVAGDAASVIPIVVHR